MRFDLPPDRVQGTEKGESGWCMMATVMSWATSDGTQGRCDDRCHSAKDRVCVCMCGGLYHGTKSNGTFDQVHREHGQFLIERLTQEGMIDARQAAMF